MWSLVQLLTLFASLALFLLHFHAISSPLVFSNSSFSTKTLCHHDESIALFYFKKSFSIYDSHNRHDSYPKTESWRENRDCCLWQGVTCNMKTGYVIELNLSSSMLYGTFPFNSSLFFLKHLQYLDLSYNDFSTSLISSHFGHFSNLRCLNLSNSNFVGQVPSEISKLSKLVSLDLSCNYLSMETIALGKLVGNLTVLRELDLTNVDIPLVSPSSFLNLSSSLSSLKLLNCKLSGKFPGAILQRPYIQLLDLRGNKNITGFLPPMSSWSDSLRYLYLSCTKIPIDFVSNLNSLETLDLSGCKFVGSNLALLGNLTQLNELHISPNNFNGSVIPYSFDNLVKLTCLDLSISNFSGQIPSSLGNLKQLSKLDLSLNNLNGQIPSSLGNLKRLSQVNLANNNLSCDTPSSLGNLTQFLGLNIGNNNLNGSIPNSFANLTQLQYLDLSNNQLIGHIPSQLGTLLNLAFIDLSDNFLNKTIPISLFILPSLNILDLYNNQLTGELGQFQHNSSLRYIDFSKNKLHGPIPSSIFELVDLEILALSSNNKLTGEISSSIYKLQNLQILDLSNNSLSGPVPKGLGNFCNNLQFLHLGMNHFNGTIPQIFSKDNQLRYISIFNNGFQGQVPQSLINCKDLEFLDLGSNNITDTFPFFLGALPQLKVLMLRSNKFHGLMKNFSSFPRLKIFDLSNNSLSGPLPSDYFGHLQAMMVIDSSSTDTYMQVYSYRRFDYSVELTIKGLEIEYERIQNLLTTIDFSQNRFTGKIPKSIGKLKSLVLLNFSHNCLGDNIPTLLGNLTILESLDLSSNFLWEGFLCNC